MHMSVDVFLCVMVQFCGDVPARLSSFCTYLMNRQVFWCWCLQVSELSLRFTFIALLLSLLSW